MKNLLINRALAAKKKKIFTFFLALVASVGTIFAKAVQIGDLYYNLDATNQTAEVTYKSCINYYQYNADWTITTANIPASVTYGGKTYTVTSIGYHAFDGCISLTSVTIPNSVTSIGGYAFQYCSGLTSVTIGNSVTSIGNYAFYECSGLTSVTIPNSVTSITSIGKYAFYHCTGLTSVTIGNSVTSIGNKAFFGCESLTSPVYNAHVFAFMPTTYSGAYTIPDGIESIAGGAFYDCSGLTSVTIPNSVTSIGVDAFSGCSGLTSVTIPNSVTSIGGWAFSGCSGLTSVTIGNSVTSIGSRAFYNCDGLTSVTIPNSVTSIGDQAFIYCDGLTSVTIEAVNPPTLSSTFSGDFPIYVPCNAVNTYKTALNWDSCAERIYVNPDCPNITVRLDPSSCSGWSTVRLWAWTDAGNLFNRLTGQVVDKDMDGWYSYTFDEDITFVNIIWSNGTDQTVNIDGVTSSTCYALNSTSGKAITVSIVDCVTGQPLGHADETTTTDVTATPNEDNSVTLTWPAVNGADTYTIEIKKNGVSVCTLVFNANGQLISINFAAPARDGKGRNVPAAEQSANGWTYIVTGLEGNASYTYSVTVKDVNGNVLLKQSVDFSTGDEQGIEDVLSDQVQCTKVIREGQIFILRGDKTYTLQGQETIMP